MMSNASRTVLIAMVFLPAFLALNMRKLTSLSTIGMLSLWNLFFCHLPEVCGIYTLDLVVLNAMWSFSEFSVVVIPVYSYLLNNFWSSEIANLSSSNSLSITA